MQRNSKRKLESCRIVDLLNNLTEAGTSFSKDQRQCICEIVTNTTMFRMQCIGLICSGLLSSVKIINQSLEHYEHEKHRKIYLDQMTILCEKNIAPEIKQLIEFNPLLDPGDRPSESIPEYENLINTLDQCIDYLGSIIRTFTGIKTLFKINKNNVSEIKPLIEQLNQSLTSLNDIVL